MKLNLSNFFIPGRMKWDNEGNITEEMTKEEQELVLLRRTIRICPACKKIMDLKEKDVMAGHGETATEFYYKCSCGIETKREYGRSLREQINAIYKLNETIPD